MILNSESAISSLPAMTISFNREKLIIRKKIKSNSFLPSFKLTGFLQIRTNRKSRNDQQKPETRNMYN